jgi:hypothetical protein
MVSTADCTVARDSVSPETSSMEVPPHAANRNIRQELANRFFMSPFLG